MNGYPCFYGYQSSIFHASMDIRLDILGFLWISMHCLAMDSRSRACSDPTPPPKHCIAYRRILVIREDHLVFRAQLVPQAPEPAVALLRLAARRCGGRLGSRGRSWGPRRGRDCGRGRDLALNWAGIHRLGA